MACVHTGVEVHNGGTVAVPFGEGQVDIVLHFARRGDDGSAPRIGRRHHMGGFVHHDAGFGGGLASPFGWEIEELERFVQFQVFNPVPV